LSDSFLRAKVILLVNSFLVILGLVWWSW
jgi:hypothetical protein